MTSIQISVEDVRQQEDLLTRGLADREGDERVRDYAAIRQGVIRPTAYALAVMSAEARTVRALSSLGGIARAASAGTIPPEELYQAAVDLLTNLEVTPPAGKPARGRAVLYFTQRADVVLPVSGQLVADGNSYVIDTSGSAYVIRAQDMLPAADATGVVIEYEASVPIKAAGLGTAYDRAPGALMWQGPSLPYYVRAENVDRIDGGGNPPTLAELLALGRKALTTRNLVSARSIDVVLHDALGSALTDLVVVGHGDPEMRRDRLAPLGGGWAVHVGGKVDVYVKLPLVDTTFTGVVGGPYARPVDGAVILRHSALRGSAVRPGDVLRIWGGLPRPTDYIVQRLEDDAVVVSDTEAINRVTDEEAPPGSVTFSVGRKPPQYVDVVSDKGLPWPGATTSRRVARAGVVQLPPTPVTDIIDVALLDPPPTEAPWKNPADGLVYFTPRVSLPPSSPPSPNTPPAYRVVDDATYSQSARQETCIVIGPQGNLSRYDGYLLRVRYRTPAGFQRAHDLLSSRDSRVVCADQLARSFYAVSVSFSLRYRSNGYVVSEDAVTRRLREYIESRPAGQGGPLSVDEVLEQARSAAQGVTFYPFVLEYTLTLPNGDQVGYKSPREVSFDPATQVNPLGYVDLRTFGVTSTIIRYLAAPTIELYREG